MAQGVSRHWATGFAQTAGDAGCTDSAMLIGGSGNRVSAFGNGAAGYETSLAGGALEDREDGADLRVLGREALTRFGQRMVLAFMVTMLVGSVLRIGDSPDTWLTATGVAAATAVTGIGVAVGLREDCPGWWLPSALVVSALLLLTLLHNAAHTGDQQVYAMAGWLLTGVTSAVAVARGAAWGLVAFGGAVALALVVADLQQRSPVALLLGPATFVLAAIVGHAMAVRTFSTTQEMTAAVTRARAAQRVAVERWRARRHADRDLHDTVLATLTVLAHGGIGVPHTLVRDHADRDVQTLTAPGTMPAAKGGGQCVAEVGAPDWLSWLRQATVHARSMGMQVDLRVDAQPGSVVDLTSQSGSALAAAVAQCLENVRRHAGTERAQVRCRTRAGLVEVAVTDMGNGFVPAAVSGDRLGLRISVREPINEIGGEVEIVSRPGRGTRVVIQVPTQANSSAPTSPHEPEPTAMGRDLPPTFDRLVIVLALQSHAYALSVILTAWSSYSSTAVVTAGVWLFSLAVPFTALLVARRHGGTLSRPMFLAASVGVLAVDSYGVVLLYHEHFQGTMWTWGALGVTILTLVPFRPLQDMLVLAVVHGAVAGVATLWLRAPVLVDPFATLADVNAAVLPAIVAAQFVALYAKAVRIRTKALAGLATAQAATLSAAAVEHDAQRRLTVVRDLAVPLLEGVATAEIDIEDPTTTYLAQRICRDIRRELVASRSGVWLLEEMAAAGPTLDPVPARVRPQVLDPLGVHERLLDSDRARLVALITTLCAQTSWERITVALTCSEGGQVAVTLVAIGPEAERLAASRSVQAEICSLGGTLMCESPDLLIVDASLRSTAEPVVNTTVTS